MARLFDDASTQSLTAGVALLTAPPFTISCWVYPDAAIGMGFAYLQRTSTSDDSFILATVGGTTVSWINRQTASNAAATSANTLNLNAWNHVVAVEASTSSRSVMLNGGTPATDVTLQAPPGIDNFHLATYTGGGSPLPLSGRLAEVGVWNVALTAAEQSALALGFSPLLIRPASLLAYWPLWGDASPEPNRFGSAYPLTLVNGPVQAAHVAVIRPLGVL